MRPRPIRSHGRLDRLEGLAAIVAVDARADGLPISWVSPGFELLTGYGAAEVLGRNAKLLQGPDTDPRAIAAADRGAAAGRDAYVTLLNYRADGTPFWNELSRSRPQRDDDGTARAATSASSATSPTACAPTRGSHELAYFDALTGLANRAALHDELRSAMHRARVHETELALLFSRPRRLQARQRRAGPSGRRRAAARRGRPAALASSGPGPAGAAWAATSSRCCSRRRAATWPSASPPSWRARPGRALRDAAARRRRPARSRRAPASASSVYPGHDDQRRPTCCATPTSRSSRPRAAARTRVHVHRAAAPARRSLVPDDAFDAAAGRRRAGPRSWPTGRVDRGVPADRRPGRGATRRPTRRWRAARRARRCSDRTGCSPRPRRPGRVGRAGLGVPDRRGARRAGGRARPQRVVVPQLRAVGDRRALPGRATPSCGSAPSASSTSSLEITERARDRPARRAVRARRSSTAREAAAGSRWTTSAPTSARWRCCRSSSPTSSSSTCASSRTARRPTRRRSSAPSPPSASAPARRSLAEGIENDAHLRGRPHARRDARPGLALGPARTAARRDCRRVACGAVTARAAPAPARTPFDGRGGGARPSTSATKRLLLPMSHHLEDQRAADRRGRRDPVGLPGGAPLHARRRSAATRRWRAARASSRAFGVGLATSRSRACAAPRSPPTTRWPASGASSCSARTSPAPWSAATSATTTGPTASAASRSPPSTTAAWSSPRRGRCCRGSRPRELGAELPKAVTRQAPAPASGSAQAGGPCGASAVRSSAAASSARAGDEQRRLGVGEVVGERGGEVVAKAVDGVARDPEGARPARRSPAWRGRRRRARRRCDAGRSAASRSRRRRRPRRSAAAAPARRSPARRRRTGSRRRRDTRQRRARRPRRRARPGTRSRACPSPSGTGSAAGRRARASPASQ